MRLINIIGDNVTVNDLQRINARKYPSKIIKMTRLDNPSCSGADDIFVKTLLLAYIKMVRESGLKYTFCQL